MPHLQPSDLTICYNENGTASAGGYTISSLDKKLAPMSGGSANYSRLHDLAVPSGLLCNCEPQCGGNTSSEDKGIVSDSLWNRLLALASDSQPSHTSRTRSNGRLKQRSTKKRQLK